MKENLNLFYLSLSDLGGVCVEIPLCLRIKEKENMFWFVIFSCAAIFLEKKKKSRFFFSFKFFE